MNSGNELPTNPYSGGPVANESPKRFNDRWRIMLYVLHILFTVAIMLFAPQPAKIVAIAAWLLAWAVFNTWKKDVPALAGGWTSFSTFVITVLASWISSGTIKSSHSQDYWSMQGRFSSIERSLYDYHESHGSYPESLADPSFEFPYGNDSDVLKDLWNKPIQYTVESDGFRLSSFGRDGVPGGIGLDSDWSYDSPDAEPDQSPFRDKPDVRLPLGQFLIDTPATFGILFPGLLFYLMLGHNVRSASEESLKSQRGILVTAIAVTVIGAAICTFLATFHIAASQSSH